MHVTNGIHIGQTDRMLRRVGFRQTGGNYAMGLRRGGNSMNAVRMRGMRRRAMVGWMRPSVKKVGAVQMATGVLAVAALFTGVSWHWWAVALLGYFFYACVGHSVGYHRYFAHRSFRHRGGRR